MGLTHLQQILRSLCFKTDWKYAVFWKLKHRARMMLTWEDAYYDNLEENELLHKMRFQETVERLHDGHYQQDPLGLAVAKMSYRVYSLGEGIIGKVGVTGKHQWVFADRPVSNSWSSSEYCDGWKPQFSAGIKTIAVVAVVPHGVLQLGSLNTVIEDMNMVTYIKDVFYSLQNSNMEFIPRPIQHTTQSSLCVSEVSTRSSRSEIMNDFSQSSDVDVCKKGTDHFLPSLAFCNYLSDDILAIPSPHPEKSIEVVNENVGCYSRSLCDDEIIELPQSNSVIPILEQQTQVLVESHNRHEFGGENSGWGDRIACSKPNDSPLIYTFCAENLYYDNCTLPIDKSAADHSFLPSNLLDSVVGNNNKFDRIACTQNEKDMHLGKDIEQTIDMSCIDTEQTSLNYSAGCELYEALGPSYKKQQEVCPWSESERMETAITEPSERTSNGLFTIDSGAEYLLEAVVANACSLSTKFKSEASLCKPAESLLTTGKTPGTYNRDEHGSGIHISSKFIVKSSLHMEDDAHKHVNLLWGSTEVGKIGSPKESSSKTLSAYTKQLEIHREPTKITRKRARPGESCRPRPRDRQLIQDRVKELRELVPNGSKCSIDSLLERTIKHMLFLQSMTKHADKLRKCDESKFLNSRLGVLGGSHEHGSSWAVEVGSQMEVCPIVVENLNMDGQMLVKMLCEECQNFFEIAETIRSLGLAILKGETEDHGEKTWACFVVEGQNNKGMHRMDVLWSLMQLLQPKNVA